jgi:hypothetical protein
LQVIYTYLFFLAFPKPVVIVSFFDLVLRVR